MIQLTRLNNSSLIVNSDLIKFVEQSPDTVITLLNGEKIIVRESAEQVLERIVQFRRAVLQNAQAAAGHLSPLSAAVCSKEAKEQSER
ncbi:MAG: flagellar FlbD family protein [Terriglobales bacterium]|jgi:flagellar protein FlbD